MGRSKFLLLPRHAGEPGLAKLRTAPIEIKNGTHKLGPIRETYNLECIYEMYQVNAKSTSSCLVFTFGVA